jgi:hypothetical protein
MVLLSISDSPCVKPLLRRPVPLRDDSTVVLDHNAAICARTPFVSAGTRQSGTPLRLGLDNTAAEGDHDGMGWPPSSLTHGAQSAAMDMSAFKAAPPNSGPLGELGRVLGM